MTQSQSLFARMTRNPRGNWTMRDIEALCEEHGMECTPPARGGLHYTIADPLGGFTLTLPAGRPIKPVYITVFLGLLRRMQERGE